MVTLKERANNIKNIRKNWNKVSSNPYMHQHIMYSAYKWIIIFVGVLITYNIVKMIITFDSSGDNSMLVLTRAFMALVGAIIIFKLYGMINMLKKNLTQYEANPNKIEDIDVNARDEIDDILKKYEVKGGKDGTI